MMSSMIGIVYFKDGHTEDILFYTKYEEDILLEFHTESGRYIYYEYITTSIHHHVSYRTHKFFESCISADDFGYVEDRLRETDKIDRIEWCKDNES